MRGAPHYLTANNGHAYVHETTPGRCEPCRNAEPDSDSYRACKGTVERWAGALRNRNVCVASLHELFTENDDRTIIFPHFKRALEKYENEIRKHVPNFTLTRIAGDLFAVFTVKA